MLTTQCGDQWVCPDATCRMEIVVFVPSRKMEGTNFRCCCGGEMVRSYRAPTMHKVDGDEAQNYLRDSGIGGALRSPLNKSRS